MGAILQDENETHYTVKHPSGDILHIAKQGLSDELHAQIKGLGCGGVAEGQAPVQNMAHGGIKSHPIVQGNQSSDSDGSKQQPHVVIHVGQPQPSPTPTAGQDMLSMARGNAGVEAPPPDAAQTAASQVNYPQEQQSRVPTGNPGGIDTSRLPPIEQQLQQGTAQATQGINQQAQVETNIAHGKEQALGDQQKKLSDLETSFNNTTNWINDQQQKIIDGIQSGDVDFNRLWNKAGTGNKILAGIGMALGSFGSGITKTPNYALKIIDDAIANDIDSQKQEMANKKTALSGYNDIFQNTTHATQALHSIYQAALTAQVDKITAGQGGQAAQAKANRLKGQILPDMQLRTYNVGMDKAKWDAAMSETPGGQTSGVSPQGGQPAAESKYGSGVDLRKLKAKQLGKVMSEDESKKAVEEFGQYTKLQRELKEADHVFDTAAHHATKAQRFADALQPQEIEGGGSWMSDIIKPVAKGLKTVATLGLEDPKIYSAVTEPFVDELAKDSTGKVNALSVNSIRKTMPQQGDSDETRINKRERIHDMIKKKYSFPTLVNNGLVNQNDPLIKNSR